MPAHLRFLVPVLACLVLAAPAHAGTASIQTIDGAKVLVYAAGEHELNYVHLVQGSGSSSVSIYDYAQPTAGDGCTQSDTYDVTCDLTDVVRAEIALGDLDDDLHPNFLRIPATIHGGTGWDHIETGLGGTAIYGDEGVDTMWDAQADPLGVINPLVADSFNGGDGADTVGYERATGVNVSNDGVANDGAVGEGDNVGSDVETLMGGSGDDTLSGGPGDDTLLGGEGADDVSGGGGFDTVSYDGRNSGGVSVTLDGVADDGADQEGDNVRPGVERVIGTAFVDTLVGDDDANVLEGNGGHDVLQGLGGDDTLSDRSAAELDGGPGDDTADFRTSGGIDLDLATDVVNAPDIYGNAMLGTVKNIENAYGSNQYVASNKLYGDDGPNRLVGGTGADTIDGRGGSDTLIGGDGKDTITSRDSVRDEVTCGDGEDTDIADVLDAPAPDCEHVELPGTDPQPGPSTGGDDSAAGAGAPAPGPGSPTRTAPGRTGTGAPLVPICTTTSSPCGFPRYPRPPRPLLQVATRSQYMRRGSYCWHDDVLMRCADVPGRPSTRAALAVRSGGVVRLNMRVPAEVTVKTLQGTHLRIHPINNSRQWYTVRLPRLRSRVDLLVRARYAAGGDAIFGAAVRLTRVAAG